MPNSQSSLHAPFELPEGEALAAMAQDMAARAAAAPTDAGLANVAAYLGEMSARYQAVLRATRRASPDFQMPAVELAGISGNTQTPLAIVPCTPSLRIKDVLENYGLPDGAEDDPLEENENRLALQDMARYTQAYDAFHMLPSADKQLRLLGQEGKGGH